MVYNNDNYIYLRKYRANKLENKQKIKKSEIFVEF